MYNHKTIEKKWRKKWQDSGLYKTNEDRKKPKYYILDMFPYPSGSGLHVGHPKGYIATDILARMRMMQGYNVLHPMGFDAFGLPTENYAIQNKIHPRVATENNIKIFKKQLEILGLSYDWEREVNTTDPNYYKWTQWIFLQMFKKGLAYESNEPINWCPSCKTGLANEDLENGLCERCGSEIEQKPMRQWVLAITKYAERLLNDLDELSGWDEPIREMQKNWIGRSEGAEIEFKINHTEETFRVFTTRLDTIFGCTYVVLAPEHRLLLAMKDRIENWNEVEKYIEKCRHKTEMERTDLNKVKTGVILRGLKAVNPFNNEEVDIFITDYVLASYGTGAIMAVPAHDERDFEFAKKFGLRIKAVVLADENIEFEGEEPFTEDGILRNSGNYTGLDSVSAREKMSKWLEKNKLGDKKINYRIKDWVFSRQRYWGEPIPIIHCQKCGVVPVPEKDLPVILPEVESYEPTGTGESPLAVMDSWVNTVCPKCGETAKRETNTMPQWAGSCWYYLRYIDPNNNKKLVDDKKEKYWSPVDLYIGGAEHATRHLIYARFWHKFLYDIGVVSHTEPFIKLRHVGLMMGEDGRKMSKRWGNVINPDEMVAKFGADSLRIYEMFMGQFDQACNWNTRGLIGMKKFLEKVVPLVTIEKSEEDKKIVSLLHKTIKKVGEDIEGLRFNTAVSALMILVNSFTEYSNKRKALPVTKQQLAQFVQLLSPFAPHLSEELWESLGNKNSIFRSEWPQYDPSLIKDEVISLTIQVNGKVRANIEVPADIQEKEALELAQANELIQKWLSGKNIIKSIFVPGRLINIVVK